MNSPWTATAPLDDQAWRAARLHAIFQCCKWDLQREDHSVLARYGLVLNGEHWKAVSETAGRLARESLALETELAARPALHSRLGLPAPIRRLLGGQAPHDPARAVRVMRFDFHHSTAGWRISEVNSDVPGGFVEASGLTEHFAGHYSGLRPAGNPAQMYAAAIGRMAGSGGHIALVHATAYSDDRQVMEYLAKLLRAGGLTTALVSPGHVRFDHGRAAIESHFAAGNPQVLIRFFPAEWLPSLGRRWRWSGFFSIPETALSNPGCALLLQSKRVPLVWDGLGCRAETWRALLPEVRCPREVPWSGREDWVLKPALGRVGEGVAMAGVTLPAAFDRAFQQARRRPGDWVAQRRFESLPVETPDGPRYPCLGVFTIDGEVAGCYGRVSARPLTDADSQDIAILIGSENANET